MRTRKKEGTPIARLFGCRNGEMKEDLKMYSSSDDETSEDPDVIFEQTESHKQESAASIPVPSILALVIVSFQIFLNRV